MISTSAISARLKGLNCMLLKPQMQPTFQWRVLEKENHEAAKGDALDWVGGLFTRVGLTRRLRLRLISCDVYPGVWRLKLPDGNEND